MDDVDHKMKRPNMRKLQGLINRAATADNKAYRAEQALANYAQEIYGCTWSDVDGDQIIDGVCGGCGASTGMTADAFDTEMRNCIEQKS